MRTGSTSRRGGGWAVRLLSALLFVVPMSQGRFTLLSTIALSVFLTVFLAGGMAQAKDVGRFIKVHRRAGASTVADWNESLTAVSISTPAPS